jgi:NAD(P)-dependent dehydrogenase (short-subunit alcohol dehydrogenase family)
MVANRIQNFEKTAYNGWTAYGQSKTANVLFTLGLAQRGIAAYAVHPGSIWDTGLTAHITDMREWDEVGTIAERNTGKHMEIDPPKSLTQGASTTLTAALSPELVGKEGSYLANCQVEETEEWARGQDKADKLWKLSEELVGEKIAV